MKLVILFLLGISQYVLSSDLTTSTDTKITCSDGLLSGKRDDNQCRCDCKDSRTTPTCIYFDEIKTTVAAIVRGSDVTDDQREKLESVRQVCLADNPYIRSIRCPEEDLRIKDDATDCSGSPLYCDQSQRCEDFNKIAKYFCRLDTTDKRRKCRRVTFACAAEDQYRNILGEYVDSDEEFADDGSFCAEICDESTTTTPEPTNAGRTPSPTSDATTTAKADDECERGYIRSLDGCFIPCVEDETDGRLVYATDAKTVTNLLTDADQVDIYKAFCLKRNSELADCNDGNIVARSDATGCGCGKCVEECVAAVRYVAYADGDVKKCRKITCTLDEIITYADPATDSDALLGLTSRVQYTNYKRREDITVVDIKYCTGDTDETTTTTTEDPTTDFCDESNDHCARYATIDVDEADLERCLYDTEESAIESFKCPEAAKCAMNNYPDKYRWRGGLCTDDANTDDQCTLGDVRASKIRYDRKGSGCAKICKCVENPRSTDAAPLANKWVCGTVEEQFVNLKVRCPSRLGSCSSVKRMSYSYCPYGDDSDATDTSDICEALSCNTDDEQTDDEVDTDVCRRSNTGFSTDISVLDDSVGCKVEVCDEDTGERKTVRYDRAISVANDNLDAINYMTKRCPNLIKCRGEITKYDVPACGVCPLCRGEYDTRDNDAICTDNTIIRGDKSCARNPKKDKTRDDDINNAIAARARVTVGFKICIDDFTRYDLDQLYDRVEGALTKLVIDKCDLTPYQLRNTRCSMQNLDFDVVGKSDSEICDLLYWVKIIADFSDIDISILRTINKCLSNRDDIRYQVAAYIKDATIDDGYDENGDVRTDGAAVYEAEDTTAAPSPATFVMYDADGEELIPEPYSSTEDTDPDTTPAASRDPSGVNGYSFIFAIIASLVAMIF